MAEYTTHYRLKKPQSEDYYDVGDFNENADIIDTTVYELAREISEQLAEELRLGLNSIRIVQEDHSARIRAVEDALFSNITLNPWAVRFENLNGIAATGVWNQPMRRLEC